ncbi:MAG: IS21 family transposase [Actinobacteria bacterium]|nr:IS21 family transposase [Actinomycetota bacterium]
MIDVTEILMHWYAGRPKSEVARSLGVDPKTVRKYVAAAEAAGLAPGGPPISPEQWAAHVRRWSPELVAPELRFPTFSEMGRHHEAIVAGLSTNTVATVWQRLHDERGLEASLASFRRYVRLVLPEEAARAAVTVLKDDPPPGEEAQLDYGYLGSWFDPEAGRRRRVWAFVMVCSASRHQFVLPVISMTKVSFVAAHVAAFSFFGGAPRRLVPDNLKSGVVKPDLYDPKLNRTYAEMATHYGTLIDPARSGHPKDKPRVERQMPYVRDSFFRGRQFPSLQAMADAAATWCLEVAGRRQHRALRGAAPRVVFEAIEAAALLPLPRRDFELASWSTPKVAPDAHVAVDGALYSVPWRLIGREIDVRTTEKEVACFLDGELVKTHQRVPKGKHATDWGDYPPDKVAFLQRTPAWCTRRAKEVGPAASDVVAGLLSAGVLHRLRAAQGVLGLVERHGPDRTEAACARALAAGDPSYRTIKGILAAGLEASVAAEAVPDSGTPAFLRGPEEIVGEEVAG